MVNYGTDQKNKEMDTVDEITPLIETAHIDQVKGMRVRVFSGHGTPKFHVKKPEDFEVRIKTPRKLPKSINDLKILDYEFKKRAIRTDEMQSLIEWLGMPDKRLGIRNKSQSNGKLERFHRSLEEECLKGKALLEIEDARKIIAGYVNFYNEKRLHRSLHYLTPKEVLEGKTEQRLKEREETLTV